jgi:hypothetical protein
MNIGVGRIVLHRPIERADGHLPVFVFDRLFAGHEIRILALVCGVDSVPAANASMGAASVNATRKAFITPPPIKVLTNEV